MYKLLLSIIVAFVMTGCTVYDSTHYLEFDNNNGFIVNPDRPLVVINEQFVIPFMEDTRLFGTWEIITNNGYEANLQFTDDNQVLINNTKIGIWNWWSPNVLILESSGKQSPMMFEIMSDNQSIRIQEYDKNNKLVEFWGFRK